MGVVVKGRDRQTGRDVAIKTLRTDVLRRDPAALEARELIEALGRESET